MRLRCGRCRTTFEAPPGTTQTTACPACGTSNRVPVNPPDLAPASPPSHGRVSCTVCGHGFVVGAVNVAMCPNCRSEVTVGGDPLPRPGEA
jgi:Zn finger protein HypA/HybF involved in hydrogenase expression